MYRYNQIDSFKMGNKVFKYHPHFRNAKVLSEKNHKFIKAYLQSDDEGYVQWKTLLNTNAKKLETTQFLLLPIKHALEKKNFCTSTGTVEIDYEYFPFLLSDEIAKRREKQEKFRESDLWFLFYALAGAKNELYELSERVGDIRPQNVFINEQGEIKVGCLYSYPKEESNFTKFMRKEVTFLAPQDLSKLQEGSIDNGENKKSQIFAIGLTVIAAGILEDPSSIYDVNSSSINSEVATQLINKWKNQTQYSQVFRAIIANLVESNPADRLGAVEIWKWISKYEPNIKSKQKFLIASEHVQIEKQISNMRSMFSTNEREQIKNEVSNLHTL